MRKGSSEETFELSAVQNSVLSGYFYSNASWTSHQMCPGSKWPQLAFPVFRPYYTPLPMFMISGNVTLLTSHSAQIFAVTPPPSLITRSRCRQPSGVTTPPGQLQTMGTCHVISYVNTCPTGDSSPPVSILLADRETSKSTVPSDMTPLPDLTLACLIERSAPNSGVTHHLVF